ncbi:VC2046/SO_2500 family protein [Flocculibacter collagenilyticus]|uniref:VC2046/SO_2500 family protein n=1 Tax=Flocculibacter collagenilyticus TaxID=2744479 RepID=UPI0018F549AC|nr:VC2046/SO_2500 family protein [Flocculibacter collagenilyticus]
MQLAEILVNEKQLGNKLNRSINEARREDFGLLLSMLSQDVLDQAVFSLPHDDIEDNTLTEDKLRKQFGVAPARDFSTAESDIALFNEVSNSFLKDGLSSAKLFMAVHPLPLALKDNPNKIDSDVINNCELSVRKKLVSGLSSLQETAILDETGLYEIIPKAQAALSMTA